MFEQTLAIIRNTFFESIRQPIMLVILLVAALLVVLANPLAAFTMEDDQRMMVDMGLATVFTGGCLLASFIATSVLTREIENKTALTVISKPVGRPVFVIGKFLGVASAMLIGALFMSFTFLLVEQHDVIETVRDPTHGPVITFGVLALVIGVGIGVWCNYFYNMAFTSTVIIATTPLVAAAYFFSMMFGPDFSQQPLSVGFDPELWKAIACLLVAIMVLTAVAVAASTRFGQVMTLVITLGVFMLGLLSDALFGKPISRLEARWLERAQLAGNTVTEIQERTISLTTGEVSRTDVEVVIPTVPLSSVAEMPEQIGFAAAWLGYAVVPNFQRLWLADALTQSHVIPTNYVWSSALYGALYIFVALSLAIVLFQRREVG